MSNYKRPVIIWGNSFYINIELKQFNKDTSDYEYFDLTKCHDVKVNLICATHNTVIPLEWELLAGYNYIMRCFVDYRLLHNTSYGIEVEGLNEDDIHWRWYMLPKEGLLVVNNSSGLNIPEEVTTVDLAGRVGWGIQTDGDLTNYYTKTEVNNLINESTDNSPYVLECWQEIDEDLRKTLAEYIQSSRDIILHEGDGADLKLFEYTIGGDNEVTFMVFHTDMGEEGTSEVTQYYWRIPYTQSPSNGWSVSVIDFLTSTDRLEVTWEGVAISDDDPEDPTYTYKIWGKHTYKEFTDLVNEGKTIQLAIHPEDQNSVRAGYRGVPDYTVTLFTCFSAINNDTKYFYSVLYDYDEDDGEILKNGLYVDVLRVDPDKTLYPNDSTKWTINLTEERIDTIEMQKKTDENTEQIDNIELDTNNNNLILQTTLDETPKVFSRVGMKTINNQTLFGDGNIDIQGGGGEQVQSDWNESDTTSPAYIQNKPTFKTINGQSILGEGDVEVESGDTVEPAKIIVTDEEVSNPDPDAVYIVQKPINLKTINGEEIVGEGDIEIQGGGSSNESYAINLWSYDGTYTDDSDLEGLVRYLLDGGRNVIIWDADSGSGTNISEYVVNIRESNFQSMYLYSAPYISSVDDGIVGRDEFEIDVIYTDDENDNIRNIDVIQGSLKVFDRITDAQSDWNERDTNSFRYIQNKPDITSIEGNIADVQNDIDNLEDDIAAQQAEISGVQTAISGHQTAIQNQATEISGMQTIIAGHQTAIQNQASEISGMQTVLAGHQTALENQSGGGDPIYYVKLKWLPYPQDSSWQGNQAIEFQSLEVWDLASSTQVYNAYFRAKTPAVVFSEIASQFAIRCNVKIDNVSGDISHLTFTSWNGYKWLYIPQTAGGTTLGNGSILQFDFYVTESSSSWTQTGICNTVTIPIGPCKNRMVTSTTSGLKIEVVSELPASPSNDTIYIVQ